MGFDEDFSRYLAEPCDEPGCDYSATHNATGCNTGKRGKYCNQHCDWDQPMFARDD